MTISDLIQVLIALVAVGASVVALLIAGKDRKTQIQIARQNREHSRLLLELDYAIQLSANRNHGGSTDEQIRKKLGAEALALAGVVGKRWVPRQWDRATGGRTIEEMQALIEKGPTKEQPEWVLDKIESTLAVNALLNELYADTDELKA